MLTKNAPPARPDNPILITVFFLRKTRLKTHDQGLPSTTVELNISGK